MSIISKIFIKGKTAKGKLQYNCICDNCGTKFSRNRVRNITTLCSLACSIKFATIQKAKIVLSKKDEFIKLANIKHDNFYLYGNIKWINYSTIINIICPDHGSFEQSPHHHLISKTGCRDCSNRGLWTNDFIDNDLIESKRPIKRIGECGGAKTNIEWQCLDCSFIWLAAPADVMANSRAPTGCAQCSGHVKLTNKIVDERLTKFIDGRNIIRIGEIKNSDIKCEFKCIDCNYQWPTRPDDILNGGVGCPNCAGSAPLTNKIIDERLKGSTIKRLGNYINNHSKLEFQCLTCGHPWKTCTKVIFNIGCGCPVCNSNGINEKSVGLSLKENNIDYIAQWGLREIQEDAKPYRIDFYMQKSKIAIEYNGAQHYRPTKFNNQTMSDEETEVNFQKQLKRDEYVRQFCKDNDIFLIEIDGRKYQNKKLIKYMEDEIIPFLNENNKLQLSA